MEEENLEPTIESLTKELKKKDEEIEKLKDRLSKAESKLLKAGLSNKYTAYVIDNYNEERNLLIEILTKHNVPVWNMNELCKRLYIILNGINGQKPIFTKKKLNTYLTMINKFTLEEYRAIEFTPNIYSDKVLYDKYEQIVRCLKGKKKTTSSTHWGFEDSNNEGKEVKPAIEESDEDEILDMTDIEEIK